MRGGKRREGETEEGEEDVRQMEGGDSAGRERERKRGRKRQKKEEGLCLISGPGECLG